MDARRRGATSRRPPRRQTRPGVGGSDRGPRAVEYEAAIHEATLTLMARRDPTELLETIVTRARRRSPGLNDDSTWYPDGI